jgi:hypothetical protein
MTTFLQLSDENIDDFIYEIENKINYIKYGETIPLPKPVPYNPNEDIISKDQMSIYDEPDHHD